MDFRTTPGDVLSTRDTREQLPSLLRSFREKQSSAEPVIVGANRKPEAVLMPYESYRALLDYIDDIAIAAEVKRRELASEDKRLSETDFLKAIDADQDALS